MATGGSPLPPPSPLQPENPLTSTTDCPQCGSLCLGPVALPCGHDICRKCLHDMLQDREEQLSCQQCGQQLHLPMRVTLSQLVEQLGVNPVMEDLVHVELGKITDTPCLICYNINAQRVCLDCQEYYCDGCSVNHGKSRATKDHLVQPLTQSLQNAPSVTYSTATRRPVSPSIMSTPSGILGYSTLSQIHDTSRDGSGWKEWVRGQMFQLELASRDKQETRNTLEDIASVVQELSNMVRGDDQDIELYKHHLRRFDVIQQNDRGAYVIRSRDSNKDMIVKTESLEKRLCHVIRGRCCLYMGELMNMWRRLDQIIHPEDHKYLDQDSSTSSGSTTRFLPPHTKIHPFNTSKDIMTMTPHRLFSVHPSTADDRYKPRVTAMVCLPEDTVVLTDTRNRKLKIMDLAHPHTISASLTVQEKPRCLAPLNDGLVAMTTYTNLIYLVKVEDGVLRVTSRVGTERVYGGIAGLRPGNMLVSCSDDDTGPAMLHVLTRSGDVVRTVTDSTRLPGLESPVHLFLVGAEEHVLVSDFHKRLVYKIEVRSGRVVHVYDHANIYDHHQLCVDRSGSVCIACNAYDHNEGCVLVRSEKTGQWRRVMTSELSDLHYDDDEPDEPCGFCLSSSGRLLVTCDNEHESVVVCYDVVEILP